MFDQRRISLADIAIGEPLPWDVYGEGNRLLLKRGQVIVSMRQAESLLSRGLFIHADEQEKGAQPKQEQRAGAKAEQPSALRFINLATKRLERVLYNFASEENVQAKVLEVVKALGYAGTVNADVCLAAMLLNQGSSSYAVRHGVDSALLARQVARAMNKTEREVEDIMAACLTMNIGMLRQQDQFQARTEPLGPKDAELVRNHPAESVRMLRQAGIDRPDWLEFVLLHHELDNIQPSVEGGIREIPQNAKIVSLADRYTASVTTRKYKKTLLPAMALRDVFMKNGTPSDPTLAAYFVKELTTYPPGSLVKLQSGEVGVVTRRGKSSTTPTVHAFLGPRGAPLSYPIARDTSKDLYLIRGAIPGDAAALCFSLQQLWGSDAAL
ncbi:HD-GYP domain-containing protein [Noviherbaspirillum galbum]|uniref:HD domain-containing protein n=1 Tax=Noviherbaspirillum galbum TaxID=2709383 RepID=A0A6B3SKE5_9BURK|nr:HD domain-containing protein [Noviherbaspirillum galbum]NEX59815.1 HD domain-containing protein [Noviherbaspirillum galbum]